MCAQKCSLDGKLRGKIRRIETRITGIVPRQLLYHNAIKIEEGSPNQPLFQTMDRLYTKTEMSLT